MIKLDSKPARVSSRKWREVAISSAIPSSSKVSRLGSHAIETREVKALCLGEYPSINKQDTGSYWWNSLSLVCELAYELDYVKRETKRLELQGKLSLAKEPSIKNATDRSNSYKESFNIACDCGGSYVVTITGSGIRDCMGQAYELLYNHKCPSCELGSEILSSIREGLSKRLEQKELLEIESLIAEKKYALAWSRAIELRGILNKKW